MSYQFTSRIRYSEAGQNGALTLAGLVDYFQDCCTFQSESIGQGTKPLEVRHRAWVLNAWQVVIARLPELSEEVCVTTMPYEFKGFLGMRNFIMETTAGERLAWANSSWSNINTQTGKPERLTEEDKAGYDLHERLEMDYAPRKIALPPSWEERPAFPICPHHLDTHHHVNNGQYVRMAEDFLPPGQPVRQLRVEYKKQALLGDIFYPLIHEEPSLTTIAFADSPLGEGGKVEAYAVVEVTHGK